MRRLVGAIALLFIAVLLVLFIPFPSELRQQAHADPGEQAGFGIRSAEIADAGNASQVAVLRLYIASDSARNLSAFCSPLPLQNNILILSFPSAPGVNASLPLQISAALLKSGLSSREASLQDALASENAVIISPAGAIPLPLLQNASELEAANSRVIVLEALSGKTIDGSGNLAPQNASLPRNFELARLSPSDDGGAIAETARRAIFLAGSAIMRASFPPGNITLAVPQNGGAYCRAVCEQGNGRYRFSDSGKLEPPPGSLYGPSSLAAGQPGIYEFSLQGGGDVGRNLRFFSVAYLPEGESFRREIAGGEIREGWASRFSLNFSRGGKYVVRMMDQFGRVHASAFVSVPALTVTPVSADGGRYEFLALLDGALVEGAMSARLDNGSPKNYSAHEGRLVIWSAPPPGSHSLAFEFSGSRADYRFSPRQSGAGALLDAYLRFGVPAAIFVLAVFLLLRAGRRAKYSITFPEVAPSDPPVVGITKSDVVSAYLRADKKFGGFSLPCYPQEIADGLLRGKGGQAELPMNAHSVLCVLRKLSQQGVFSEHEGAFIPTARMGGFAARELLMLRSVHECMLERGLRFSRKRLITVNKGVLEIALFRGRKSLLSGIGKACRAVIFESEEELGKFTDEIAAPGFENSRIRLALGNDKIVFVVASRNGLGGILP